MNPRQDRKRDLAERMAHLEETMARCRWPAGRGIAEFIEIDAIEFNNAISEQQYWDEEWKGYIAEQQEAIIDECRYAEYEDDYDNYGDYDG